MSVQDGNPALGPAFIFFSEPSVELCAHYGCLEIAKTGYSKVFMLWNESVDNDYMSLK